MESTPNTFPALIDPTIVSPGVDNKSTGENARTQVAQASAANLSKSYYIPDSLNTPTAKIRRRVAVMLMVLIGGTVAYNKSSEFKYRVAEVMENIVHLAKNNIDIGNAFLR